MFSELLLAIWSCAGLTWWFMAWRLVATADHRPEGLPPKTLTRRSLSIFKPLPPLGARGLEYVATGLESFLAQLDDDAELLLGIHEIDRAVAASFVDRMHQRYPNAQIKVVYRCKTDDVANPKIAWQKILAAEARGELWLWSDAEMIAPPGFLLAARADYERSGLRMVTFPYVVREIPSPQALLDALFVNVEFYPGVLLLRKRGTVDFGLGAAMLFARSDFELQVNCEELGSWLADDFILGQKLSPVQIGSATLETRIEASAWKEALLHQLRWNKTIRWNRPAGFAARILVLPVLGWLIFALLNVTQAFGWIGLSIMMQVDVFFAAAICHRLGCRTKVWNLLGMEMWSLWRVGLWLACWVPWPVTWRGRLWWGPRWT